jgi:acetyltransferase-like isoleucine patch superfamily enzyme
MRFLAQLLVRAIVHLSYRWNRLRNACRIGWLRCKGVRIGKGCYIGRGVEISLGEGASLTLGEGVVLNDRVAFFVGPGCSVEIGARTYVGRYCEVACNTHLRIGRDCAIAAFCTIIDTDHVFRDPLLPVNSQGLQISPVAVDDEVWIGYKATVLRGVELGRHSVVGANSVVTRSVAPFCVAAGSPAAVVKQIDRPRKEKAEVNSSAKE